MSAQGSLPVLPADVFAALGDPTRLGLVADLGNGAPLSIAALSGGRGITRQAITKHLHVLENAGLVQSIRHGRESRFALRPDALVSAREYLDRVTRQWDNALGRLRAFVED